jgi:D-glycero-D-manno-heptose 1,7-bisphosphate phosphatase
MKSTRALFLDRDGVINTELPGDYVKGWDEFVFEPGVFQALSILKKWFDKMIVVTNQRGVGIDVMSRADLDSIHERMCTELATHGIHIDAIYCATAAERSDSLRKPNPTMGHQAVKDHPTIDLTLCWIAGNSESDIQFGKNLGVKTVFIDEKGRFQHAKHAFGSDEVYPSLLEWALSVDAGNCSL